jgi:transposase
MESTEEEPMLLCTFDRDVNAAKNMLVKGIIFLQ